ncbi:MAG: nucleotidyltransferase family protein [Jatrophihabitans sp.]|nr:MAG: nucleotidyltransferase family protein [Jatrophihabitans sp.]
MGVPKGELVVGGQRLVDRAVRVLRAAGCEPVIAVVRVGVAVSGAEPVPNPDPERGMRSSLAIAVEAAADATALVVLLADMPGVTEAGVRAVVAAWRPGRITVARYGSSRGHPTVMEPARWRAAIAAAGADEGARAYLAVPTDLDVPADLAAWREH